MARFYGGASSLGPLQLQLGAVPSNLTVKVTGVEAEGETESGSTSPPVLTRPGTVGNGDNFYAIGENEIGTALTPLITAFGTAPSTPVVVAGAFNLPYRVELVLPHGSEIIVAPSSALLLYANTSGGHTWSARFHWEEL